MRLHHIAPGGLVVALVGFGLTRFTVSLAAVETQAQFVFGGVVPLVLGLGLSVFGVVLATGAYDRALARTTAGWCLLGTASMLVLVVLTLLGMDPQALRDIDAFREQAILSNFLIGGAVGGTLTGLYAGSVKRQRRELRQQTNRLTLLNRLLRDRVINAATVISGYATELQSQSSDGTDESAEVIRTQAESVIGTVENLKYLTRTTGDAGDTLGAVDIEATLERAAAAVRDRYPDASCTVEFDTPAEPVSIRANDQLQEVFEHLLENGIEHSERDAPTVRAAVEADRRSVTVSIADDGPGLPSDQRAVLERGDVADFDDPTTGFGLNVVRLLTELFDGRIDTSVDESGSTVTIEFPRLAAEDGAGRSRSLSASGLASERVAVVIAASLVAGGLMGVAMQQLTGLVPVIGALYGVENAVVGAITHEFHSVVFGLVYAALLSILPLSSARQFPTRLAVAVAFGLVLWLFAAGIVMPLWLRVVGVDAGLPSLTAASFVGHLVWGLSLAVLYHAGDRWLTDGVDGTALATPSGG